MKARELQALAVVAAVRPPARPPSRRELAAELGCSIAAAQGYVRSLAAAGLLEVTDGRGRALLVTPAGHEALAKAGAAPELPGEHGAFRNRYVFSHARDAVRCWAAHRDGRRVDRSRSGRAGGRSPSLEDVVRVGRILAPLLTGPQHGVLVAWARGLVTTTDRRVQALVERVELRLRSLGIVARAGPAIPRAHRSIWMDDEGQVRETTGILYPREEISRR